MPNSTNRPNVGQELLNVPMGDMIRQMAFAIADAQLALDLGSADSAQMMGGKVPKYTEKGGSSNENKQAEVEFEDTTVYFGVDENGDPQKVSLLELGFTPTFYQFVDTIIEVKIDITLTESVEDSHSDSSYDYRKSSAGKSKGLFGLIFGGNSNSKINVTTNQVNARHSQKYNFSVEGSSLLRTKLVPVPPPAVLEERIRRMMEKNLND
ncbi:MAG TPA: hypothetical protein VK027_08635 [Chitinophagaceae bacterium]|nr:hypothetical protein [Chitinophagaceae bacterium]